MRRKCPRTCLLHLLRPLALPAFVAPPPAAAQQVFDICSLEELDLRHNAFTTLPDEVSRLTTLRALRLCNNKLRVLPEGALQLPPSRPPQSSPVEGG